KAISAWVLILGMIWRKAAWRCSTVALAQQAPVAWVMGDLLARAAPSQGRPCVKHNRPRTLRGLREQRGINLASEETPRHALATADQGPSGLLAGWSGM